jgi:hypothetical protein
VFCQAGANVRAGPYVILDSEGVRESIVRKKNVFSFIITAIVMTALGAGLGMAGGYIGARTADPAGFVALGLAILGMLAGYVLGTVAGLLILTYAVRVTGSVMLGILTGVVWTGISIGVASLLNLSHHASSVIVYVMFLLTPAAALLGFYMKRAAAS